MKTSSGRVRFGMLNSLMALILIFTACTGGTGADTTEGQPEDVTTTSETASDVTTTVDGGAVEGGDPVQLTMTVWTADPDVIGTYESIGEAFAAIDPRMSGLTVQSIPFDHYLNRVATQLSGGDPPDIGWLVGDNFAALIEAGALTDVGEVLRNTDGYNFDDILPETLVGLQGDDDELFGYPFANTTQPVVVNLDLFEAAGVDNPVELWESGEWTWNNLARVSRELVESGIAEYGYDIPAFGFNAYPSMTPIINGFGAEMWPGAAACGWNTPEMVDTINFLRQMVDDDSYPGPGETSSFPTGNTGMYSGPPSSLNQLTEADFNFDLIPQPEGTNGLNPPIGQAAYVAFSNGEQPDLAADFLAFLTTEENSRPLTRFFISPRRTLQDPEIVAEVNPLLTPEGARRSLIDTMPLGAPISFPALYPQIESAIRPVLDQLWLPDADVEGTLAEVCAIADPLLASSQ